MGCLLLLIVSFILFVIVCFDSESYFLGTMLLGFSIWFFTDIFLSRRKKQKEIEEQKIKMNEANDKKQEKLKNVIIPAYNKSRAELIKKYGNPTKIYVLEPYNLNKVIIAFEESKRIWICGKEFQMKSLLSCIVTDDKKIVKGQITSTTKTSNGDMVKRAVVGNVLLGGVGTVLGGSTANKSTITTQEDDKVYHNYTLIINIDSLLEPIISIYIGSDIQKVNEIAGLINVIINRNNRTTK